MAQQGNPFFVDPTMGAGATPALTAQLGQQIGGIIGGVNQKARREEIADEVSRLLEMRDFDALRNLGLRNPEFQKFIESEVQFANNKSREAYVKSLAGVVRAGGDEKKIRNAISSGYDEVILVGGEPDNIVSMAEMVLEDPEMATAVAEASLAALSPKVYKTLKPQQRQLADRRSGLEKQVEYIRSLDDAAANAKTPEDKAYFEGISDMARRMGGGYRATVEEKAEADIRGAGGKEASKQRVKTNTIIQNDGIAALDLTNQLVKLREGLGQLTTGGLSALTSDVRNFFGISSNADLEAAQAQMKKVVLGNLAALKGVASDTDLLQVIQASPRLQASTSANLAIIDDMLDSLSGTIKRGYEASKSERDEGGLPLYRREFESFYDAQAPAEVETVINWRDL